MTKGELDGKCSQESYHKFTEVWFGGFSVFSLCLSHSQFSFYKQESIVACTKGILGAWAGCRTAEPCGNKSCPWQLPLREAELGLSRAPTCAEP